MAWRADLRERSVEGRGYRDPGRRSWLDRLLWSDPLRQARSRQSIHPETRSHAAPCNLCAQLIRYLSAWSDREGKPPNYCSINTSTSPERVLSPPPWRGRARERGNPQL